VIRVAIKYKGDLSNFLKGYDHEPDLTKKLDSLPENPFSQKIINEIVLWKVNRYPHLSKTVRLSLQTILVLKPKEHKKGEDVLMGLLNGCKGIDLRMASTILRFRNPRVFQIIDKRAYRTLYGKPYKLYSKSSPKYKIFTYFEYLDELHKVAELKGLQFSDLDRILYKFDKKKNGKL
jgi:thermostable 8-oxoguanine DNA glycosylase